ncbi:MAG: hypothetical protein JNK94_08365 [Hyphomonadaceae bacterium]|nr:hypothetical protein [Hyphomonadaceae bacterium]MBX3511038.1 hypothetical protein [Hyphomonadaceae bacterium]
MLLSRVAAASLAVALCAACASTPPPEPAPPQEDTCGLARFAYLVGARAAEVNRDDLPPRARIIHPNQAVTMDFSADRLNLIVDAEGRVSEMRCF